MLDLLIIFAVSRLYFLPFFRGADKPPTDSSPKRVWELTDEAKREWIARKRKAVKAEAIAFVLSAPVVMGSSVFMGGTVNTAVYCQLESQCIQSNLGNGVAGMAVQFRQAILAPMDTAKSIELLSWPLYWSGLIVTYAYLLALTINILFLLWLPFTATARFRLAETD